VRIGTDGVERSHRIPDANLLPDPELPAKINQWWNIFVEQIQKVTPRGRALKIPPQTPIQTQLNIKQTSPISDFWRRLTNIS
jgi:hypothetical protein